MLTPLKLLDIMANDAEAIAKSWAKDVVKNTKTPFYHYINADYLIPQAADFYRKLSSVYTLKDPYPSFTSTCPNLPKSASRKVCPCTRCFMRLI